MDGSSSLCAQRWRGEIRSEARTRERLAVLGGGAALEDSGDWLLHGHTHLHTETHAELPRQIHVGWDAWRKPVCESEILRLMRGDSVP